MKYIALKQRLSKLSALYELREGLFVEESHWTHKRNSIIPSDFRLRQGGNLFGKAD
jgi:hypothetical protein